MIPIDPITNKVPQPTTVKTWLAHEEWIARTEFLDGEVEKDLTKKYVASRVEMFERHAEIGREMQIIAVEWLRDHKDELGPGTAVRLLVDGVDMEQSTASIPEMIKKLKGMDDEKLLSEIQEYITELPSDIDAYR